jgi:hypothetical protein
MIRCALRRRAVCLRVLSFCRLASSRHLIRLTDRSVLTSLLLSLSLSRSNLCARSRAAPVRTARVKRAPTTSPGTVAAPCGIISHSASSRRSADPATRSRRDIVKGLSAKARSSHSAPLLPFAPHHSPVRHRPLRHLCLPLSYDWRYSGNGLSGNICHSLPPPSPSNPLPLDSSSPSSSPSQALGSLRKTCLR